jgi:DNA-binding HxlR family transcriptional regulator
MIELTSSDLTCPFTTAQKVLSGKWSLAIIFQLKDGPIRFNELLRKFDGLTHASLTKQLRQLESFRLIHREVYNQVPPKVEYSLTDLGKGLYPTINGLTDWGSEYIKDCKLTEANFLR